MLADYRKVQGLIAYLPEGDLNMEITFTEIALMSANVNKLWVWGETESAYQVREFFSQVNEMAWLARGKAEAIRTLKRRYIDLQASVEESTRERDRVAKEIGEHEAMAEHLHKEQTWRQLNEPLKQQLKDHDANRSAASDLLLKVSVRIVERREAYQEFLIEAQDKLMIQVNKVMALARGDVQLDGDVRAWKSKATKCPCGREQPLPACTMSTRNRWSLLVLSNTRGWRTHMSDWEFLYEMNERGYSAEDIADAAACGVAPWEWKYIDKEWIDYQLEDEPGDDAHSLAPFQSREGFPFSVLEQTEIFGRLG